MLAHGSVGVGEASMTDLLDQTGIQSAFIPELGRKIAWSQDVSALRRLFTVCRAFRPHIIHTHTAKAGTLGRLAGCAYRLAASESCRLAHTYRGHVFSHYFGRCRSAAVRQAERRLATRTDRILVISPQQQYEIVSRYRIAPATKVRLVRLGLDLEPFTRNVPPVQEDWGWGGDLPVIGIVGRLVPIKNHELFLRAARRFVDSGATAGFLIVGGGESESHLQLLARQLDMERHVRFAGWRRDLPSLYRAIDVVTLTSFNEGTPVTLIEAMASARPVVSTAVGGVEDVVEHERNGLLVPSGDHIALANSWRRLVEAPALAAKLAAGARASVILRYSKAAPLAEMERTYLELMGHA